MQILLIGASGYLGGHMYNQFKKNGHTVVGTYYKHQTDKSMIPFDINKDDIDDIDIFLEDKEKCAVICAAETKLDTCENEKEESFQTNVLSTIKIIEELKARNYYIVFCSTESVYDGKKGNYTETDSADAVNEYGRMKIQIEQYIMKYCSEACIFRIGRVVGDALWPRDILFDWKKKANEKKDIYCIRGNYFAPVDVEDVVNCVELACSQRIFGIYNLCGDKIYSRAELCISFLQALGLETNVCEKDAEKFNFSAERPLNIGMSNQKVVNALCYKFKSMEEVYERYGRV